MHINVHKNSHKLNFPCLLNNYNPIHLQFALTPLYSNSVFKILYLPKHLLLEKCKDEEI